MNRKIILKGTLALGLILSVLTSAFILRVPVITQPSDPETVTLDPALSTLYQRVVKVTDMIADQEKTDADLLAEFQTGNYTFDNPLIVVDPYHCAPLTAMILFKTDQPVRITIHIQGKTEAQNLDYDFSGFATDHQLPVFGLYGDTLNKVTITTTDQEGQSTQRTFDLQTESIPEILKTNLYITYQSGLPMSPGFTFTFGNGYNNFLKTALDAAGDYRWVLNTEANLFADYQNGKSILFTLGNLQGYMLFVEMNYLGKILSVYYSPYGCHHDVLVMDQKILVTGSNNAPNTIDDFIYSIDKATGLMSQSLDYKTMLERTRQVNTQYTNQDWLHMNSIVEYQGDVIVSNNFQSSVIRNDWEGNIKWILSEPTGYTSKYLPYLLMPIGKDFLYPFNQHAAEVLPDTDGNPDTLDILLFDNGTSRYGLDAELQRKIKANEITAPALFSRIVVYRINEKDMTVQQLWQYGKERPELFASARGNANLLDNGNYLALFQIKKDVHDGENDHAVYLEVNASGKVVWEMTATSSNLQNSYIEYRTERFELYNENTQTLHLGVPARNLIPQDVLTKAFEALERTQP